MEKRVYLYGLGGEDNEYPVIRYAYIRGDFSIEDLKWQAKNLRVQNPSIEHIFAVDGTYTTYHAYKDAVKGDMSDRILFKIYLETEGIKLN